MRVPELLAPAGNMQSLIAAVRCGADAVYLGAENFNARRNASNFSLQGLASAIKYCHARGVKVYITLNTIVSDDEINNATEVIKCVCAFGADALILQDLGLAKIAGQLSPDMPLHASTQMSVQTASGLSALSEMGFCRAILPRELTFEEIKVLCMKSPIALETFVHGALCMSVSGQCYMSAMLGSRSGNRGLCAQPCRLPFKVTNGTGHDLSLKDLSLIGHLSALADAGVKSFKIEGRMKRPEYVAAAVTACRQSLNGQIGDDIQSDLRAVFSRSGFTAGYFDAKTGRDMFGTRQKEDVVSASPVLAKLHALYKNEAPVIPVDFNFQAKEGAPAALSAFARGVSVKKVSETCAQKAVSRPLDSGAVTAQLQKCGGTPFFAQNISIDIGDDINIPLSAINALRRDVLAALEAELSAPAPRTFIDREFTLPAHKAETCGRFARFADIAQIPENLGGISKVILPLDAPKDIICSLSERGIGVGVEIPRGIFGDEMKIGKLLKTAKNNGAAFAYAGTLDAVQLAKDAGLPIMGGYSLNCFNSQSLDILETLGLEHAVLSVELTLKQAARLGGTLSRGLIAYGNIPLMLTRNCPLKNGTDCGKCGQNGVITDRKGIRFPVVCHKTHSEVLNSRPIYLADKLGDIKNMDFLLLYFTVEDKNECRRIIDAYKNGDLPATEFTRGLYYRGVE